MSAETKLQTNIRQYLKRKGCYVLVISPQPGIPDGCPDIIAFIEGAWIAVEVKNSPKAKYQPLQEETLKQLDEWSWAKRVDPSNWPEIRQELEKIL